MIGLLTTVAVHLRTRSVKMTPHTTRTCPNLTLMSKMTSLTTLAADLDGRTEDAAMTRTAMIAAGLL